MLIYGRDTPATATVGFRKFLQMDPRNLIAVFFQKKKDKIFDQFDEPSLSWVRLLLS